MSNDPDAPTVACQCPDWCHVCFWKNTPPPKATRSFAFVWSRALGTVREGQMSVHPAIAQSAAGPVEGIAIIGSTFHGKTKMRREDMRLVLFRDDARRLRDVLSNWLDDGEEP